MRKKLLAFLLMTTFGLSSCANVKVDSNVLPETNGNDVPQTNLPNSNITPSVDEEVKPTSGLIVGNAEENTLEKEEIYDQDGSLKVPFDIAYPEFMGDTLYDENSLLIKIEDNKASALPTILKSFNVDSYSFVTKSNKRSSWYKVHFEGYKSREIINDVRKIHPFIQMVDLNYIYNESNLDYEPSVDFANQPASEVKNVAIGNLNNNPMYKNQWHFNNIGYAEAYKYIKKNNMPQGGEGITVAVIDTGVDIYHEDLKENIWTNMGEIPGDGQDNDGNGYIDDVHGVNIVDPKIEPLDDHGHGTHVAGIIGATNNTVGVVGVAYNSKIMPIKAADSTGIFTQDNIAKAITYAYMNGADIINMSFGGPNSSMVVEDALKSAYTTSILVASAGNDGFVNENYAGRPSSIKVIPNYPAALSYVLGVTSVGPSNVESAFSNLDGVLYSNQEYEVAAPGENILSTLPNNKYGKMSGTSMSAPMVSGMAAVLRAYLQDRDKFPTKYIYGQIASTSSNTATCLNSKEHGSHNLTKIANLYSTLSIVPKPDVNLFNYYIFDNKEYSAANNGDGKLDAGETIYLMPTLTNRWGMSESTTITFDVNQGVTQIPSQYVNLIQNKINFDSVGTYSTKTFLKISEDGTSYEGILDLSNAIKFEISKDAPNGIGVTFNYVISFKNGLDGADNNEYINDGKFDLTFNKGILLPKIIRENTELTTDNLYIINKTISINKDVELIINEGVQIQFYAGDDESVYGKKTEVCVKNYGNLIINGTKEKPVKIFPESKHGNFECRFENYNTNSSAIYAQYCFIQNFTFTNVDGNLGSNFFDSCVFDYNYNSEQNLLLLKYDNDGRIIIARNYLHGISVNNSLFKNVSFEIGSSAIKNSIIKTVDEGKFFSHESTFLNTSFVAGDQSKININVKALLPIIIKKIGVPNNLKSEYNNNIHEISFDIKKENDYKTFYNILRNFIDLIEKNGAELIDILENQLIDPAENNLSTIYAKQITRAYIKKSNVYGKYSVYGAYSGEYIGDMATNNVKIPIDHNKPYLVYASAYKATTYPSGYNEVFLISDEQYFTPIESSNNLYFKSSLNNLEFKKIVFKVINDTYSNCIDSSINILNNNDFTTPNVNIAVANIPKGDGNFYEIDDSWLNLNTEKENIIDEIITDGHDSSDLPILINKGTEKTWLKDCWPYVTKMELTDKNGVKKSTFNNEAMTCTLHFNREMSMNTPLRVRFGSSKPYTEYEIPGTWIDATTWQGTYVLNTTIENGTQRFSIEGGAAASDSFLTVHEIGSRFKFNIDTTAAQAMMIQGNPTKDGIELTWLQDDYETLLGYNIYRSETKDGNYKRVNKNVISKEDSTFLDTTVEPGKTYWYTFTVVFSDLSESKPAGKSACTAYDTMNPNIYHSPIYQGYTSSDLIVNCTITDNIGVTGAKVFYRTKGETQYKSVDMTKNNDRYSAKIPSKDINIEGLEYYISATDGTNTITKGSETNPYEVVIKDNSTISNKGDVDGDNIITVKDAYMILKHIGGELVLSDEEFRRADLNGNGNLETNEALKILQYINGVISSLN